MKLKKKCTHCREEFEPRKSFHWLCSECYTVMIQESDRYDYDDIDDFPDEFAFTGRDY
jgi:hypothetical protein